MKRSGLRSRKKVKPGTPAVKVHRDGREVCQETPAGRAEYKLRRDTMWRRQRGVCPWCGQYIACGHGEFDHENGRGSGGGKRDDRIIVDGKEQNACLHPLCNSDRGSTRKPYRFPCKVSLTDAS